MLAAALAGQPRLLVADEPTTALDATVAAQILRRVLEAPEHPHTRGLVACSLSRQNDSGELHTMEPA